MRIGLIVNPVAGMGGAVGLKGTDGADTVAAARRLGAVPQSGARARRALAIIAARCPGLTLIAAPGALGADHAEGLGMVLQTVPMPNLTGTAADTLRAVHAMADVDLIVFAGGDGTARDILAALPQGGAMLGIPCGVKMHSGVFAASPETAGHLIADLITAPDRVRWHADAEVMDIDEAALRAGHIAPQLYGLARVPFSRSHMQAAKGGVRQNAASALAGAAGAIVKRMQPGTLYIIGPGTSAGAVTKAAGHTPTILGADALRDGALVLRDTNRAALEAEARHGSVVIVLGVTGQQGFLLGRGNQQIGPDLIRKAGRGGLEILATSEKLAALAAPCLWVDTGDAALDAALAGFVRVQTDQGRFTMMRIAGS
jgi:predicted polyphosphate/ATP-dependent NAD kinase